jgi:hypothetical protein
MVKESKKNVSFGIIIRKGKTKMSKRTLLFLTNNIPPHKSVSRRLFPFSYGKESERKEGAIPSYVA